MNPKSDAGPTVGIRPVGTHSLPFHFQAPSGELVVSHVWPSQNHRPSGETCPFSSTLPFPFDCLATQSGQSCPTMR